MRNPIITDKNFNDVKKEVQKHPRGIAMKELISVLQEQSKFLGPRPRDEKPPGKDKIFKIIYDGNGKDWDYVKGTAHTRSIITPRVNDPLADYVPSIKHIRFRLHMKKLDDLLKKKNKKFSLTDMLEFVKIRDMVLIFPMDSVYHGRHRHTMKQDDTFKRIKSSVLVQIKKINDIEIAQQKCNKKFKDILKNIDDLRDPLLLELILKPKFFTSKEHIKSVNYIQKTYKIRK